MNSGVCSRYVPTVSIRAQLLHKALLALDEVVDQAKHGPVAPSFAIRFALAYLYVCALERAARGAALRLPAKAGAQDGQPRRQTSLERGWPRSTASQEPASSPPSVERWPHDAFWREMQKPNPDYGREAHRDTAVRSALNGIMRQAGIEPTFEVEKALRDARAAASPEEIARRRMAAAIRAEAELRRAAADEKRKAKDCGWL